jgi:hypothetical protein
METFLDQSAVFTAKPDQLTQPEDAVTKLSGVPPQLVEDVMDNPELLKPVARAMAATNLHNLFVRMSHPATPNRDRLEFQAMLNKMGGLETTPNQKSSGPGFSINIVLPGHKKELTIEGTATPVNDE